MSFWFHCFDQNSNKNIVKISALEFFLASLRLPGSFFWASCRLLNLWYYLLNPQKGQKASRKPPGSYKKFQGRNLDNIFGAILVQMMTPKRHFEINWPLVLTIWDRILFFNTITDLIVAFSRSASKNPRLTARDLSHV